VSTKVGRLLHRGPRIVSTDARAQVVRLGESRMPGELYHWLITTTGWRFGCAVAVTYFGLNVVFALAYLACGNAILNAHEGSFLDAFFFSVQTMATIGYGQMAPVGIAANLLVTLEAGIGLFGIAVASGLMVARFTRPTAGVRFSNKLVVTQFEGRPTLMLRLANQRSDRIHEARIHVTLLRDETTVEGHQLRRLYDLELDRSNSPMFALSWTVRHTIGPASPLYGKTPEELAAADTQIIVVFAGHHSGFYQDVHARTAYDSSDIVWNARFADLFRDLPDGRIAMDFAHFDEIIDPTPTKRGGLT
jgi:inward rectifier potassium channel